jgi:hypothetical protein
MCGKAGVECIEGVKLLEERYRRHPGTSIMCPSSQGLPKQQARSRQNLGGRSRSPNLHDFRYKQCKNILAGAQCAKAYNYIVKVSRKDEALKHICKVANTG